MGSLAKRLGQLARASWETESSNILKTTQANKRVGSLAHGLDGTLKDAHDMKVFGLGTMASMANPQRYHRFSLSMYAIYQTMEQELDQTTEIYPKLFRIWQKHGSILKRRVALEHDLRHVLPDEESLESRLAQHLRESPATKQYVEAIQAAGKVDRETHHATLTGHLYCRYFADLFGGQMLALPYQYALRLPESPRFYEFDFASSISPSSIPPGRRAFIEDLYSELNHTGETLQDTTKQEQVVREAYQAFAHNIDVYSEEPIYMDGLRGGWNMAIGFCASRVAGGSSRR